MLTIRRSEERGHAQHGWLDSYHTFSFADYHDPRHMGFRSLRVINEDRVEAGRGFGTHGHRDMEIVSYVLSGALQHRDSMGTGSVLRPGDVQRMSAGSGVTHSEFNGSQTEKVHFLQIWIQPSRRGIAPSYEEKKIPTDAKRGLLKPIVTPDGADGSLRMTADAAIYATVLGAGEKLTWKPPRHTWIHVAKGLARVGGQLLGAGDAASSSDQQEIELEGVDLAEILVFDLG